MEHTSGDSRLNSYHSTSVAEAAESWHTVTHSIASHQWLLAAIAAHVMDAATYGEGRLDDFAQRVGYQARTIREYAQAFRAFKNGGRSPNLTFSHHVLAARTDEPKRALEMADSTQPKPLSVRAFREALKLPEYSPPEQKAPSQSLIGELELLRLIAGHAKRDETLELHKALQTYEGMYGDL